MALGSLHLRHDGVLVLLRRLVSEFGSVRGNWLRQTILRCRRQLQELTRWKDGRIKVTCGIQEASIVMRKRRKSLERQRREYVPLTLATFLDRDAGGGAAKNQARASLQWCSGGVGRELYCMMSLTLAGRLYGLLQGRRLKTGELQMLPKKVEKSVPMQERQCN